MFIFSFGLSFFHCDKKTHDFVSYNFGRLNEVIIKTPVIPSFPQAPGHTGQNMEYSTISNGA